MEMFPMHHLKTSCAILCASLFLVACGGGDGGSAPKPTADAGPDQTVEIGSTVSLNGAQSAATADGGALRYTWSLTRTPTDSTADLSDDTSAQPTFLADLPGTYEADLVVNDGTEDSNHDSVTITATNPDPVAIAETEHHVLIGTLVELDGSESVPPTGATHCNWNTTGASILTSYRKAAARPCPRQAHRLLVSMRTSLEPITSP